MKINKIDLQMEPKIYKTKDRNVKGNIFYFHGGGLIFGSKHDLPKYHIETITGAGYNIFAFNYLLAPESEFTTIFDQVLNSINLYSTDLDTPYFLLGRSAGAYLCLLAISKGLNLKPSGIISYYGYGFLKDKWYNTPSKYYLKYPIINFKDVENLIEDYPLVQSPVNPRFLLYLYSRQTGKWLEFLTNKCEVDFIDEYSLRKVDFNNFPPVYLAHNTNDNDVPYEESIELKNRIKNSELFSCTTVDHDFDRNINDTNTRKLIQNTIAFMDKCLL